MRTKSLLVVVLIIINCGGSLVSAQNNLIENLQQIRSFKSDFVEHRYDENGQLIVSVPGTCSLMRPNMFRWHYLGKNEEQLVISDGTTLWVYEPELEQVFIKRAKDAEESAVLQLLSQNNELGELYKAEQLSSDNWYRLRLVSDELNPLIDVHYVNDTIKSIKSNDPSGRSTIINFITPEVNLRLPESDFKFEPPSGIDIIDDYY